MSVVRGAAVVAWAALAVAGCRPDDTGAVLLHVSVRTDLSVPATYSSSTAAVALTGDGLVHLTATSNQGLLRLVFVGPLILGAHVELLPDELHFVIRDADWANDGGAIDVLEVDPAIVSFVALPMSPRAGSAAGTFTFDGGGTFREP